MNRGYVLVWRKIQDSGLMQIPNTLAVFLHLLFSATHKDIKVGTPHGVIELKRGQYISGRKKLSEELEQSERQIRTSLDRLVELKILTIKSTTRYSIYTIENYGLYQDANQKQTNKRPTDDQRTTTKQTQYTQNTQIPIPDWIDADKFYDFYNHRISIKKPMTDEALIMAFNKLKKIKDKGHNINDVIDESIINGWSGLFEPKGKPVEQKTSYIPKGNLI